MKIRRKSPLVTLSLLAVLLLSCRGQISDKPPIHLNPNMDFQPRKDAQELSRELPEGVVAFGESARVREFDRDKYSPEKLAFNTGKQVNGEYVAKVPVPVNYEFVKRGQSRFNIYCATCHDRVGTSRSIIIQRGVGIPPPPLLASENIVNNPDGRIFETITYGRGNMSGYAVQIDLEDRWAIVAYVRALQKSRNQNFKDVAPSERYLYYKDEK